MTHQDKIEAVCEGVFDARALAPPSPLMAVKTRGRLLLWHASLRCLSLVPFLDVVKQSERAVVARVVAAASENIGNNSSNNPKLFLVANVILRLSLCSWVRVMIMVTVLVCMCSPQKMARQVSSPFPLGSTGTDTGTGTGAGAGAGAGVGCGGGATSGRIVSGGGGADSDGSGGGGMMTTPRRDSRRGSGEAARILKQMGSSVSSSVSSLALSPFSKTMQKMGEYEKRIDG